MQHSRKTEIPWPRSDAREAQRREATLLCLVTRLDRDLLLDEDQRQKISESLLAKWQAAWGQQIEIVLQNDQFMLQLPDNCILPHLNKRQRTIWQGLPKSGGFFGWNAGGMFGFMDESGVDDDVKDLLPPVEPAAAPGADGVGINVIITN
jgi:hypothetical protein